MTKSGRFLTNYYYSKNFSSIFHHFWQNLPEVVDFFFARFFGLCQEINYFRKK